MGARPAAGAVTGNVTIPTEQLDFNFAGGTWTLERATVEFHDIPGTQTFVEDLTFDIRGGRLVADQSIDPFLDIYLVMAKR